MSMEDLEMHDMIEERKEEEEGEEEETSFNNGYNNNLENFDDSIPHYDGDLPSTSYERPESNKDKTLKTFVRRKYGSSFKLDTATF